MNDKYSHLSKASANVLIVDDTRANLRLLEDLLTEQGYHVRPAPNGRWALTAAQTTPPDLILLDIMMPEMDGYEVCRHLKADERTCEIPIIFISAVNETVDKVKAFSIGGIDYITKPFQAEEVLARVRTHLTISKLQKGLQEKNDRLQEEITKRQQVEETLRQKNDELTHTLHVLKTTQEQLIESKKMAALGGVVAGVAHEINTPIGVGVTAASTLENKTEDILTQYKAGTLKGADVKAYLSSASRSSQLILTNLLRAQELVQSFKQVAVDQTNLTSRTFAIKGYIEKVLLSLEPKLKRTSHQIVIDGEEDVMITSFPGAFSQLITNLVINSLTHAYPTGKAGLLHFEFHQTGERILMTYSDDGCGIPPENQEKIFEPFFTTARSEGGTGLGLHIVYNLVMQTLKGTLQCESRLGEGTTFIFTLPVEIA